MKPIQQILHPRNICSLIFIISLLSVVRANRIPMALPPCAPIPSAFACFRCISKTYNDTQKETELRIRLKMLSGVVKKSQRSPTSSGLHPGITYSKWYPVLGSLPRVISSISIFLPVPGVISNAAHIYGIFVYKEMRTATYTLLGHLAMADILVILYHAPFQEYRTSYDEWNFMDTIRKTTSYMRGVSLYASLFILTIFWVGHCRRICQKSKIRKRYIIPVYIILPIWMLAFIIPVPWVFHECFLSPWSSKYKPRYTCGQVWPPDQMTKTHFMAVHVISCFMVPLSIIGICYFNIKKACADRIASEGINQDKPIISRHKIKVTRMMSTITISFVLSCLPLQVLLGLIKFHKSNDFVESLIPYAHLLIALNSSIRPFVYAIYSKRFRQTLKYTFQGRQ